MSIKFKLTTSSFETLCSHFVDPPGETSLVYWPNQVKKKGSVTLMCSVKDEGRPPGPTYQWLRGGHVIHDVSTANWTIDPVTLETESNFTCIAENDGGPSVPATVAFKVLGKEIAGVDGVVKKRWLFHSGVWYYKGFCYDKSDNR